MNKKTVLLFLSLIILISSVFLLILYINRSIFSSITSKFPGNFNSNQPTPFQPFIPSVTPTPEGYFIQSSLMPVSEIRSPLGQVNILLLGSDYRPESGYRTDVILLVSILTKEQKVRLISFPRDLFIEIPGYGKERINTTQAKGGFSLTNASFEYNFGIHLDHYLMTNLSGFQAIVDTLGGIEINASENLYDRCDLPYAHGGYCSVGPGAYHLDGPLALWYVRSRSTTSDFDRLRRAQEVLEGLFHKLITWDAISRAPDLYDLFINSVETDLSLNDISALLPLASKIALEPDRVERYSIDESMVSPTTNLNTGGSVLSPDYNAIWQVIQQAIYTP